MQSRHRHHIVPRHAGGDNSPDNITPPLSLRMHAMFHLDRWKALGNPLDMAACLLVLGNARGAERFRREASVVARRKVIATMSREDRQARWGRHKGTKASQAVRDKIRAALTGKKRSSLSEETKRKISATKAGRRWTPEHRNKMIAAHAKRRRPEKYVWSQAARERFTGRKCPWVSESNRRRAQGRHKRGDAQ